MSGRIAGSAAALALLLASVPASVAAPAVDGGSCLLLGMVFSQGAVMRVGSGPKICKPDGTWSPSEDQAAGCIYEGKLYSTGALKPLPNGSQPLECLSDGTWSPVPAMKKTP
ncbi:MAG: hypothetical protein ACTHJ3_05515 [Pararhizobium sp.]